MRLTTKMRYGTRAMLDLALHEGQGPLRTADIASDQELSLKYLEQLLAALRVAGLVQSSRGVQGGYVLARPAQEITLRDIYQALEGAEGLVECTMHPEGCPRAEQCVTQEVWAGLYAASLDYLAARTLSDLTQRARERQSHCAPMYYL